MLNYIKRPDVYRLIMRSRLPAAEQFERWVVEEVLPAIDDHGGYLTPSKVAEALLNPDVLIQLATTLKEEQAARAAAEAKLVRTQAKLTEASGKAQIVDATFARRGMEAMKVYEIARKMTGCRADRIKRDLMELGYLYRRGQQYHVYSQYHGENKLFIEKEDPRYFKHEIYATKKGAELIARLFNDGHLTMKKGGF